MNEITSLLQEAKVYAQTTGSWIILPLHSALSIEEQDKVMDWTVCVWGYTVQYCTICMHDNRIR